MSESRDELLRRIEELEGQVESLTAKCSALNEELESFSYSVSHDLRAPLRSIHGFSKILLNKYQAGLDETGQDYLQRVMRASNHMGELLDGLLQLSRVSRNELSLEPIDMRELALQAMEKLRESPEERDLCFEVEHLPVACGDHKLLAIVMWHLLGNALKFSSMEATPCIRVSASEQDGVATYTVADNGVGFDKTYANKLFGAFQRLHSSEEFEGTGIGLATVQRIVHRHGGSIYAEAEPGKGARFHFVLNTITG